MTIIAIHQPQYLPWLPYLAKAESCDIFVYLDDVQYQKRGVQNSNSIKTANGQTSLTVPVHATHHKSILETPIDNSKSWQAKHLKTIDQSYAKAPYISLADSELRPLINSDYKFLADLNIEVTNWMLQKLEIKCTKLRSSELNLDASKDELIIQICQVLGATEYLSGQGAKAYQDKSKFNHHGITLLYQKYEFEEYKQCWPKLGFMAGLSTLDLILNTGLEARKIMKSGIRSNE
jgi:hypothetical protein